MQLSNIEELARELDASEGLVELFRTFEYPVILGVMRGRGVFEVRAGDARLRPCEDADQPIESGNDEFRVHAVPNAQKFAGSRGGFLRR